MLDAQRKCIGACKFLLVRCEEEKELTEPMLEKRKYRKNIKVAFALWKIMRDKIAACLQVT